MYLTILYLLNLLSMLQPTEIPEADSLVIFSPTRTYHYQATFISPAGDTLSRERIAFKPSSQPWKYDKDQTAFEIRYNYTPEDSLTFLSYLNPQSKKKKKPQRYIWDESVTTGAKENEQQVWIHPIRNNQYNYTEVAPYPDVRLDSLEAGGEWNSTLLIMMGWGAFKGKVESHYQVVKQEHRQYGSLSLDSCWLVHAVGKHSKLADSYLDFYFHPEYGFVEMNYRFYDGTKISFVLEEVIEKEV